MDEEQKKKEKKEILKENYKKLMMDKKFSHKQHEDKKNQLVISINHNVLILSKLEEITISRKENVSWKRMELLREKDKFERTYQYFNKILSQSYNDLKEEIKDY